MRQRQIFLKFVCVPCALILLATGLSLSTGAMQKLKPEDIVQKHLASIGTPEAIAAARNRVVKGASTVVFRPGPDNKSSGTAEIISAGKSVRLSWIFAALNYPGETFTFDGSKVGSIYVKPGVRSMFTEFINSNDVIVKEGLLGGTLSTAWALLDVPGRKARIEYNGLKKRGTKDLHEIRYIARKGGGEVRVLMYFDPQTFRHVQTQYALFMMGQTERRYFITEDFDNFVTADGLTLPTSYKMNYTVEESSSAMIDWTITASEILHNQQIDPKTFTIQ